MKFSLLLSFFALFLMSYSGPVLSRHERNEETIVKVAKNSNKPLFNHLKNIAARWEEAQNNSSDLSDKELEKALTQICRAKKLATRLIGAQKKQIINRLDDAFLDLEYTWEGRDMYERSGWSCEQNLR